MNPKYHPRTRTSYLDYDYIDKLSPKEREFLARFTDEYYGGAFEKTESGNYSTKNLHKTQKLRRECYKRNRDQNYCQYNMANLSDRLNDIHSLDLEDQQFAVKGMEDSIIAYRDLELLEQLKKAYDYSQKRKKATKKPNRSLKKR